MVCFRNDKHTSKLFGNLVIERAAETSRVVLLLSESECLNSPGYKQMTTLNKQVHSQNPNTLITPLFLSMGFKSMKMFPNTASRDNTVRLCQISHGQQCD